MNNLKIRIWDKIEKKWFTPVYKKATLGKPEEIHELLINQNGDISLHEARDGQHKFTHEIDMEFKDRYIKQQAVGIRDVNGSRYFFGDIVQCDTGIGVLVWDGDKLGIGSGPIDDYTAIDRVTEHELRQWEIKGNILQHRHLIMGTEGPQA